MRIYLQNIPDTFYLDPIWNDEVLGFFDEGRANKKNNKMNSDMVSVPDPTSTNWRMATSPNDVSRYIRRLLRALITITIFIMCLFYGRVANCLLINPLQGLQTTPVWL